LQDQFAYTTTSELGTGWTVAYSGPGTGTIHADGNQVSNTLSSNRTAVCRRVGYTSTTDNQVIEIDLGTLPQWFFDDTTYVDFWPRMLNTGTPGTDGVRVRLGADEVTLSSFVGGTETVLSQQNLSIPPRSGGKWKCVAGDPKTGTRHFKLLRNGAEAFVFAEPGTTSQIGSTRRSAGFGLHTDSVITPPGIRRWSAGDNSVTSQTGFVKMINAGDQDMWPRFTCFGPGTFSFGNGPSSPDFVQFGPLLPNQAAQIRTDPRKRGVLDLSTAPAVVSQAEQEGVLEFFGDILSFVGGAALVGIFQSLFGLLGGGPSPVPPQGNLYSLLQGRFSNPVPAKSPGNPAVPYQIPVKITNGTADSLIIAAGTPLRRLPY
jgi:hypothetical protein